MILIVDDTPENIFSLKKVLEINGFKVDTADSGEAALKKILNQTYALIILDVQMPGMDGFEVAEALGGYSRSKETPIIFLSAVNIDKRFITKGYTAGGVDYVTKPVDIDIFMLKVKNLYRLSQQKQDLIKAQESLQKEIDIRKKAELEISKTVNELKSTLQSMPQIAFTLTPDGGVEFVNEKWYLYNYQTTELPAFHPEDKEVMSGWQAALKEQESFTAEVRLQNVLSHQYRYHLLKIIPVTQNNVVTKWVGSLTDIHEQKAANEVLEQNVSERTQQLQKKNEELEATNYELQQFAFVASHDLKEPLRKIQVFGSMLNDMQRAGKNDEIDDYIGRINRSSERMRSLIDDLLEFSRLSIDSLFEKTDVTKIINDILVDLQLPITEKKAVININTLPVIDAVPGQMRQVFQNLIVNALKFTKEGIAPVINIWADFVDELNADAIQVNKGAYCRFVISDNGIGFSEKYIDKIFAIFQRLHTRDEYEGTGIGLAIAKKIIEKHKGLITARSNDGNGAAFIIILPVHQNKN